MLTIVSMNRAGLSDERLTFIVTFEFDNTSTLPERAFNVGNMSYVLAKGSTAKNVVTGTNYEYTGSKWVKTSEITNSTSKTSTITDNGNYNITNNDFVGFNDISVDVAGGGVGFQLMNLSTSGQPEDLRGGTTYINNDSATVDLTTIFSTNNNHDVTIINPVDELRVTSLESFGNGYYIYFVPTQNCKVYEDSTELDLNDIFQSQQTPSGPTTYEPNGVKVHYLEANYHPYDGKVRKLSDKGGSMYLTIE